MADKTPAQPEDALFWVLINQHRDTVDFGWWDENGAVPIPTPNSSEKDRKAIKARREKALHVALGSQDDRGNPDATSPRSKPIPDAVFKRMVRDCAALRGMMKPSPDGRPPQVEYEKRRAADLDALNTPLPAVDDGEAFYSSL